MKTLWTWISLLPTIIIITIVLNSAGTTESALLCPKECQCVDTSISCAYFNVFPGVLLMSEDAASAVTSLEVTCDTSVRYLLNLTSSEFAKFTKLESLRIKTQGLCALNDVGNNLFVTMTNLIFLEIKANDTSQVQTKFHPSTFAGLTALEKMRFILPRFQYRYIPPFMKDPTTFPFWPWGDVEFPKLHTLELAVNTGHGDQELCNNLFKPFTRVKQVVLRLPEMNLKLGCLENIQNLTIWNADNYLVTVVNFYLNSIPSKDFSSLTISKVWRWQFGGTSYQPKHLLKRLRLHIGDFIRMPEYVKRMKTLTHLEFTQQSYEDMTHHDFLSLTNLEYLDLSYNSVRINKRPNMKPIFDQNKTALEYIDLSYNYLGGLDENLLKSPPSLKYVNLSHNLINTADLGVLQGSPIKELNLAFNNIDTLTISGTINLNTLTILNLKRNRVQALPVNLFRSAPNIRYLNLANNIFQTVPVNITMLESLEYLNLRDNPLTTFDSHNLVQLSIVSLQKLHLPLKNVHFLKYLSGEESKTLEIYLHGDNLDCSKCESVMATYAIFKFGYLKTQNVYCRNISSSSPAAGRDILAAGFDTKELGCINYQSCFSSCNCYWHQMKGQVFRVANCSDSFLTSLPRNFPNDTTVLEVQRNQLERFPNIALPNLWILSLKDNSITEIKNESLQHVPNLRYLSLEGNGITHIPEGFFNHTPHMITANLTGNPIKCDCSQRWIKDWMLQQEKNDRTIFVEAFCSNSSGTAINIKDFDFEEACVPQALKYIKTFDYVTLLVVLVLLIIVAILILLIYICRKELQVWIINRGWWKANVLTNSAQRTYKYDAYIAYCDNNYSIIRDHFIPRLEQKHGYRLFIRDRDSEAGQPIAENVANAISKSYCTIALLSNSAMESEWFPVEFELTHSLSVEDKSRRLVIVKVGHLSKEALKTQKSIQLYLTTKTYLSWTDPDFWDKMHKILPDKPHPVFMGNEAYTEDTPDNGVHRENDYVQREGPYVAANVDITVDDDFTDDDDVHSDHSFDTYCSGDNIPGHAVVNDNYYVSDNDQAHGNNYDHDAESDKSSTAADVENNLFNAETETTDVSVNNLDKAYDTHVHADAQPQNVTTELEPATDILSNSDSDNTKYDNDKDPQTLQDDRKSMNDSPSGSEKSDSQEESETPESSLTGSPVVEKDSLGVGTPSGKLSDKESDRYSSLSSLSLSLDLDESFSQLQVGNNLDNSGDVNGINSNGNTQIDNSTHLTLNGLSSANYQDKDNGNDIREQTDMTHGKMEQEMTNSTRHLTNNIITKPVAAPRSLNGNVSPIRTEDNSVSLGVDYREDAIEV
ncbi:protein toll-like [Lingula anatina]|uniref:Protein toll-like n=1 Tax=Lingula anatina TaxID=7574 RepID=A0A2R2MJG9_LINAN|nr:protein toll-like [Lingula anatina]|eukprot:XP_023930343.1 protein toll-like [Lingula anatina]